MWSGASTSCKLRPESPVITAPCRFSKDFTTSTWFRFRVAIEASASRSRLLESYVLVLVIAVIAVSLSVIGMMLLVTCETAQYVGPFGYTQIGCTYPFQGYGETFLLAAGIVGTFAVAPIWRIANSGGRKYDWNPWFLTLLIDTGLVILYVVVLIVT